MTPELSIDIEQAVQRHHGCLQVKGQQSAYIVMSIETFREMMGVGSDEDLSASLRAIEEGLKDVDAGRTRPVGSFFQDFDVQHGIQR